MSKNPTTVSTEGRLFDGLVSEMMTRDVATIHADETIHDAMVVMAQQNLAALPVVNSSGKCVGIVSRHDLAELFLQLDDEVEAISSEPFGRTIDRDGGYRTRVRELMSPDPVVLSEKGRIVEAASMMSRHRIHHVPVIDEQSNLIGIVSSLDIATVVGELLG